jgi:ABC-type transport system involved in multi-copper enzyme maturation permease subunit
LFFKELREALSARAFWVMLVMTSLLVGFSFIQATSLYAQASQTALQFPELARGLTPLDGIWVPTFGAIYLVNTLLFPFVAIRLIGNEQQSGSLKLLLQLPPRLSMIVLLKLLALMVVWLLALVPGVSAIVIWLAMGGHVGWLELLNLLLGHALYALAIAGIGFFAAAVSDSSATAAIITLAFTLGSWVLDFAASSGSGLVRDLSMLSLTAGLRTFERGMFTSPAAARLLLMAFGLLALSAVWLQMNVALRRKWGLTAVVVMAAIAPGIGLARFPVYADVSENRRNSFNPADERALRELNQPLQITIYLSPEDSRLVEMERGVLAKLRRVVPDLRVVYGDVGNTGIFGGGGSDNYGLIAYDYAGRHDESRSNSEEEILSIIHGLAGQTVTPDPTADYPGYPLAADAANTGIWFYGILPLLCLWGWWLSQRPPRATAEIEE